MGLQAQPSREATQRENRTARRVQEPWVAGALGTPGRESAQGACPSGRAARGRISRGASSCRRREELNRSLGSHPVMVCSLQPPCTPRRGECGPVSGARVLSGHEVSSFCICLTTKTRPSIHDSLPAEGVFPGVQAPGPPAPRPRSCLLTGPALGPGQTLPLDVAYPRSRSQGHPQPRAVWTGELPSTQEIIVSTHVCLECEQQVIWFWKHFIIA